MDVCVHGASPQKEICLDLADVLYEQGFMPISPICDYNPVNDALRADRYHWLAIQNRAEKPYGNLNIPYRIKCDIRIRKLSRNTQAAISRYLNGPHTRPSLAPIDPILGIPRLFAQTTPVDWELAMASAGLQDAYVEKSFTVMGTRGVANIPTIYEKIPEYVDMFLGVKYHEDYRYSACCALLTTYYLRVIFDKLSRIPTFKGKQDLINGLSRMITFMCSEAFSVQI